MKPLVKGDSFAKRFSKAQKDHSPMLKILSLSLILFCAADFVFLRASVSEAGSMTLELATVIAIAVTSVSVVLSHIGGNQAAKYVQGERKPYRLAIAIASPVLELVALAAITYFRLSTEAMIAAEKQALAETAQATNAAARSMLAAPTESAASDPVAFTILLTVLLVVTFVVGFVVSFLLVDLRAENKIAHLGRRAPHEDLAIQRPALEAVAQGDLRRETLQRLDAQAAVGRKKLDCLLVLTMLRAVKDPADANRAGGYLRDYFSQGDQASR